MALSRYGKADKIYDDGTGLLSAIVRRFKVDGQYTTVAQLPTAVFLAYETADEEHDDCLLAHQDVKSREGADPQESILTRVYVQIPTDAATLVQIGNDLVTYSENGLKMVEQRFFGKRTHSLAGTVGTTTGASGDINTLILTSNGFAERGKVSAVVVKRWAEAGILSVRTPLVGGQQTVSVSAIGMTEAAVTTALASVTTTHVLINQTVGSYLGFQTKEFTYEVDDFETRSKTENGLQLITQTELGTANYTDSTIGVVGTGDYLTLYRAGETIDNGNTIKKRVTRWAEAGILNRSEDKVGSQNAITLQTVGPDPSTPDGYSIAKKSEGNYAGFQTNDFTFLKNNVQLSASEDLVGSQNAKIQVWFNPTTAKTITNYSLAKTQTSDFSGIETTSYTFLKPSVLSVRTPLVGGQQTVQVQAFDMTEDQVKTLLTVTLVTTNYKLIDQSISDYGGIETTSYTYEVDDFVVRSQSADGMQIIARTELATADFSDGVVGTDTSNNETTLYLIGEEIDNGNTIKKRTSRYSEAGLLSIRPVRDNAFSLAPSYIYVTTGAPASSMTGLIKPDGNALGTAVTWFEPEVQNVLGFPTYTQLVIAKTLTGTEVKVHSTEGFYVITDPGIMSTGGAFHSAAKSGGAVRYPQATTQPRTYRRKATVDVYLTSLATISEVEVAYSEKNVNWCSIAFDSFSLNEKEASASVSANWRNFSKFLNSPGTTGTSYATTLGEYFAEARSYGAGDTTYVTDGIYRVIPKPYMRDKDGNQLYLKTVITF